MSGIQLRDCPMCHAKADNTGEGVMMTKEVFIDTGIGADIYDIGYTVRCAQCGASVSHEYRGSVVSLWNGVPLADDEWTAQ